SRPACWHAHRNEKGASNLCPSGGKGEPSMAFVVCEPCRDCKYTDCVVVCPCDCFYQDDAQLYIDPDVCIDCDACVPECPVEAICTLAHAAPEEGPDELRVTITDAKIWRAALQAFARVLKGWQEEADPGSERRSWRWLIEGDVDTDGYDHAGEPAGLWGFIR